MIFVTWLLLACGSGTTVREIRENEYDLINETTQEGVITYASRETELLHEAELSNLNLFDVPFDLNNVKDMIRLSGGDIMLEYKDCGEVDAYFKKRGRRDLILLNGD